MMMMKRGLPVFLPKIFGSFAFHWVTGTGIGRMLLVLVLHHDKQIFYYNINISSGATRKHFNGPWCGFFKVGLRFFFLLKFRIVKVGQWQSWPNE